MWKVRWGLMIFIAAIFFFIGLALFIGANYFFQLFPNVEGLGVPEAEQAVGQAMSAAKTAVRIAGVGTMIFGPLLVIVPWLVISRLNKNKQNIVEKGVQAVAEILSLQDTGSYVNNMPRLRFRLRVTLPTGETYETDQTKTVPFSAMNAIGIGSQHTVFVDPNNRNKVVMQITP